MRAVRATLAAGLGAGLVACAFDLAAALALRSGPYGAGAMLAGAASVLLVDLTLGLLAGVLVAALAIGGAGWSGLEQRARWLGRSIASIATGSAPEREPARVGALAAATTVAALAAAVIAWLSRRALPRVALEPAIAWPVAALAAATLIAAAALFAPLSRALRRGIAGLPAAVRRRLTVRAVVLLAMGILLGAAAWNRDRIGWLLSAVGAWPLVAIGLLLATAGCLLLACAGWPEATGIRVVQRTPVLISSVVALALMWAVLPGRLGQRGAALRLSRADAPLAALGSRRIAGVLDGADEYAACADEAPAPPPPPPAPVPSAIPPGLSVVVIMIDALRYDHLHLAGYPRRITPNIDRLAGEAVVFEQAYAPSAYTQPSVSAIMTSRLPSQLPGVLHKQRGIPAGAPTLARRFADAGHDTLFLSDYGPEAKGTNFEEGFAEHHTVYDRGDRVTELALRFIEARSRAERGRPFFLWASYFGPHAPYRLHPEVPQLGRSFMDLYDQEIAFTDRALAPLLARLQAPPLRDRVAVVLISDHGEAFGEHGAYNHGHNLHQENVHVPLILRVPGVPRRRIGAPVSLLDVAPTLLNLARLPVPGDLAGHDLTALLVGGAPPPERAVFIESDYRGYPVDSGYQAALVIGRHKLVVEDRTRSVRLFDLEADPEERADLAGRRPDLTCELLRLLRRYRSGRPPW